MCRKGWFFFDTLYVRVGDICFFVGGVYRFRGGVAWRRVEGRSLVDIMKVV